MDRSFAARAPVDRRHSRSGSRRSSRNAAPPGASWARRWSVRRPLALALSAIAARRRVRIAAICLIVAVPLLGGGWLWLRHSSLVAVEHIRITGVHGPQAHAIESALRDAAKGMSTLDAKPATLQAAVARFPAVSAVRAIPRFPHNLRIEVTQQPAVAALLVGGIRTAVSGRGIVLGQSLPVSSLPTVADDAVPGPGSRLRNVLVLEALSVLAAAPSALDHLAAKVYFGSRGLTVEMRNGLLVLFGDATLPHAKWLSLASVLADKSSAGATYVDVRLPGRPAAGFPPGAGPGRPEESATGESLQGKSESTVATLAAGLAAANPETKKRQSEEAAKAAEGTAAGHATEGGEEAEAAGKEGGEGSAEPSG